MMNVICGVFTVLLLFASSVPQTKLHKQREFSADEHAREEFGHIKYDQDSKTFTFHPTKPTSKEGVAAWGTSRTYLSTQGWDEVHVQTNGDFNNMQQTYAAGFLEGALTRQRMFQFWRSWSNRYSPDVQQKVDQFIVLQDNYLRRKSDGVEEDSASTTDTYWHHVGVVLSQFDGMLDGYNLQSPESEKMRMEDLWLMNLDGDILDIERAVKSGTGTWVKDMTRQELIQLIQLKGHCSALIKWTGEDLLIGHTTWADFSELYRSYKHYTFALRGAAVRSQKSSFSSYPGFVSSTDDYYLLDSGLAVIETTLNILDESLYQQGVDPSSTVMAWVRNIVANRLAGTAKEWADLFSKENSGTYNNQWMIVDYNKFTPHAKELQPGTLWILEQIPGYIQSEDSTHILQSNGYWASYNRPYFKTINEKSMYKHFTKLHGEMFSYLDCPRAQIFKREHKKVHNIEDMKVLMQYNRYQEDDLSDGCPGNTIASRFDLPPLEGSRCDVYPVTNGATDSKISNYELAQKLLSVTRGGPTWDDVPSFSWRTWKKTQEKTSARLLQLSGGGGLTSAYAASMRLEEQSQLLRQTQASNKAERLRAEGITSRREKEHRAKGRAKEQVVCEGEEDSNDDERCAGIPHGQPDQWAFEWMVMGPSLIEL